MRMRRLEPSSASKFSVVHQNTGRISIGTPLRLSPEVPSAWWALGSISLSTLIKLLRPKCLLQIYSCASLGACLGPLMVS